MEDILEPGMVIWTGTKISTRFIYSFDRSYFYFFTNVFFFFRLVLRWGKYIGAGTNDLDLELVLR